MTFNTVVEGKHFNGSGNAERIMHAGEELRSSLVGGSVFDFALIVNHF